MADEPKISKHHAGQHPALKSFRAFDIIPPSKVKPTHTARPVITNPVKHFDTTLTPPKAEEPQSAMPEAATPKPAETTLTPVEDTVAVSQPEPATSEASPELAPTASAPELTEDTTEPETTSTEEPEKADEPPIDQPELAVPESAPKPAPSAQAASDGDLNSILDQEAGPQTQLQHSPEFKNVLKEFAAQTDEKTVDKPIVAVHKHDYMRVVMQVLTWLIGATIVAALVIDVLLDTKVLQSFYGLPHTHFFVR